MAPLEARPGFSVFAKMTDRAPTQHFDLPFDLARSKTVCEISKIGSVYSPEPSRRCAKYAGLREEEPPATRFQELSWRLYWYVRRWW